jgi:anti-anti-sigma factor
MAFAVDVLEQETGAVVAIAGDIDLATAPQMVEAVRAELQRGRDVRLDLSAVTFVDSTGLHALVRLMGEGASAPGAFAIGRDLLPPVEKVLQVSGILKVLPFAR